MKGKTHSQIQAEEASRDEVKTVGKIAGAVAIAAAFMLFMLAIENRSFEREY